MHCADICLSATHNESARKLVMTQFEPCQYRHKSRYASVLQNRCFYTYIWLAYLVRFFERLLRQTTPKLLPLFECLPLLFLLMSLRYSGIFRCFDLLECENQLRRACRGRNWRVLGHLSDRSRNHVKRLTDSRSGGA